MSKQSEIAAGRYGRATRLVIEQREWMQEHGGDLAGYVKNYGSIFDAEHYGDGGEAIFRADQEQLNALMLAASEEGAQLSKLLDEQKRMRVEVHEIDGHGTSWEVHDADSSEYVGQFDKLSALALWAEDTKTTIVHFYTQSDWAIEQERDEIREELSAQIVKTQIEIAEGDAENGPGTPPPFPSDWEMDAMIDDELKRRERVKMQTIPHCPVLQTAEGGMIECDVCGLDSLSQTTLLELHDAIDERAASTR